MFWRAVGPVLFPLLIGLALALAQGVVAFESLRFRVPAPGDLTISTGTVFFNFGYEYKRGLPLGVKTPHGNIYVSCRVTSIQKADCVPYNLRASIVGKPIAVSWVEEPIFLWQREKRAFQIDIDGSPYLSNSELIHHYEESIPDWFSICLSLLGLGAVAYAIAYRCNREYARISHTADDPALDGRPPRSDLDVPQ